jgi:mRNA interferase RelE/StbE
VSGVKKLKGYDKTYRIRVGDYRIIYKIEDQEKLILILSSIHRKDAY